MRNKKDDHVNLAMEFHHEEKISDFDNLKFVHNSFSEIDLAKVDTSTSLAGYKIDSPFFINAMTGGSLKTKEINRKLSQLARALEIPMASGSLSVAVKDQELAHSFKVIREENPKGIIMANLGAEHSLENAKKAIDILEADILQIHVNTAQELVMPEGDRNFSRWLSSIEKLVNGLDLPIIVKEVGFGMSRETLERLESIGVKIVDLGGYGGTNFAKIENFRRDEREYNYLEDFGQSTVISLLEAQEFMQSMEIIATGGIRNPLDIVKSLSLGASSVGVAGSILDMVVNYDLERSIEILEKWKYEIKVILTLLGKEGLEDLKTSDLIIKGSPKEWCEIRGIDYKYFGNRGRRSFSKDKL